MGIQQSFGPEIWTVDGDSLRMFGVLPFTTRMTVIRLRSGGLWVHSPVLPTPERVRAIGELGPVEHLVAPNKIHSLGIKPWKECYPSAKVWASPAFSRRHPEIAIDEVLANGVETVWSDEITHCAVEGHAILDEVVFLHKRSKTLIVTDLIQKHEAASDSWFWRSVKALNGILGRGGGVPRDVKLSIRDKVEFRRSLTAILDWDFENLVLAHGHCLRGGAKKDVSHAFSWITDASSCN
ncbi:DUF4336 domain-containing protein [Algihabitans sp.]|uniref:DUF4336 domain-containing protein n=1 Tax=Algihabitans sp. TaxID=2821514 RepID=UPI003BAB982B